jgi:hypothetical protein
MLKEMMWIFNGQPIPPAIIQRYIVQQAAQKQHSGTVKEK